MESTGVYWIPLYQVLEERGIKVCLVNARHMRNVPGRRTDWHECQWLQYLHSVGLLRAAFRPDSQVCAIRAVMRHRSKLVELASHHIQHVHKSLTQMNVQLPHHHSSSRMGAHLRRIKAKLGPPAAVTATAHKIARIFYAMVKNQVEYDETNWQTQDEQWQRRLEAKLKRQAHQLGYQLVPIQPTP